jgi:hypothetical protein
LHSLSQLESGQLLGCTRLSISENLTQLPEAVFTLADSLEILDLTNNNLSSLPDRLVELSHLRIIFLSKNQFEVLPEVLGQCANLEMIGIKSNKIKQVPANSLPPKLRWLTLTDNEIEALPDSLGERPSLQKLMLAGNRLRCLPQSLSKAHNLELLRVSANQLTEFPQQVFQLPKLAWFAFSGNPFSQSENVTPSVPEIASSQFTLDDQLGEGASGIIFNASWNSPQTEFPTDIAVKKFKGGVTSDGYPKDELASCLQAGNHPNLVRSIAQVNEPNFRALVMSLIPSDYKNLGQPPSFKSCTRDTFPDGFSLSIEQVEKIIEQMKDIFTHLHAHQVAHGDLYAHNTLFNQQANILFGDFGAASMYHMLSVDQQQQVKMIEQRALFNFIADILSVCNSEQRQDSRFLRLCEEVDYKPQ